MLGLNARTMLRCRQKRDPTDDTINDIWGGTVLGARTGSSWTNCICFRLSEKVGTHKRTAVGSRLPTSATGPQAVRQAVALIDLAPLGSKH